MSFAKYQMNCQSTVLCGLHLNKRTLVKELNVEFRTKILE